MFNTLVTGEKGSLTDVRIYCKFKKSNGAVSKETKIFHGDQNGNVTITVPQGYAELALWEVHTYSYEYYNSFGDTKVIGLTSIHGGQHGGFYDASLPSKIVLQWFGIGGGNPTRVVTVNDSSGNGVAGAVLSGTYQGGSGVHPTQRWTSDGEGKFNIYKYDDFTGKFKSWVVSASGYVTKSGTGDIDNTVTLTGGK